MRSEHQDSDSGIAAALVGRWRLVDFEVVFADGARIAPFGDAPQGWGIYTADGWMSAQLMRPGRQGFGTERIADVPPALLTAAAAGYIGYAGRYEVDTANAIISHHVEVALLPDWVGTVHRRDYRFENGLLLLSPPERAGTRSTLRWRREAG